jgi:hypothetical protein
MRRLALLFLAFACGRTGSQAPGPLELSFVGCYEFQAASDSLRTTSEGGLGDSLPGRFTIRLTADPIPPESNPDHGAIFLADWDYLKDVGMTAWMTHADSLIVRGIMYGWSSDFHLGGTPERLTGWGFVTTHRGFYERASLASRQVPCN